jgi:2-polyprenyl-3-methyl-5-hydroxy-6-metoxy-1,4-benzoquinol methylase
MSSWTHGELDDAANIERRIGQRDQFEADFDYILRLLRAVRPVEPGDRMFEIGAGIGWLQVLGEVRGFRCEAVEHNEAMIVAATQLGSEYGVTPTIHHGDATTWDYGTDRWDVIVATSVFEHIRDHRPLMAKLHAALAPGGALYLYSTNKFSLRSGEFEGVPLYGWLPYGVREHIRLRAPGGHDVVETAHMDFNQFTYWGLKRDLRQAGFVRVLDRIDLADPQGHEQPGRRALVTAVKTMPPLRMLARIFESGNTVIAVKGGA